MKDVSEMTMTVKVPIDLKRRRGRKRLVAPDGSELAPASPSAGEIDNMLVKAIARAHRWQRMLESGEYATLRELAKAERIKRPFSSREGAKLGDLVHEDRGEGVVPRPSTKRGSLPGHFQVARIRGKMDFGAVIIFLGRLIRALLGGRWSGDGSAAIRTTDTQVTGERARCNTEEGFRTAALLNLSDV